MASHHGDTEARRKTIRFFQLLYSVLSRINITTRNFFYFFLMPTTPIILPVTPFSAR